MNRLKEMALRVELDGCEEYFWDSEEIANATWPRFSPCFQHTVLTFLPCLFLWIWTPLQLYYFRRSEHLPLPWTFRNILKIVLSLLLSLNAGAILCYSIYESVGLEKHVAPIWFIYPSVILISMVLSALLIFSCKKNGVITSGLLFFFWFLYTICGSIEFVYWINLSANSNAGEELDDKFRFIAYMIFYPLLIVQLILSAFADKPAGYKEVGAEKVCPEVESSSLNRITFWWFTPLAWQGWKKTLETDDLWPLNVKDSSKKLIPAWEELWHGAMGKYWEKRKNYIPPPPKPPKKSKVLEINGHELEPLDDKKDKKEKGASSGGKGGPGGGPPGGPPGKLVLSEREQTILKLAPSLTMNLLKMFVYPLLMSGFMQLLCDMLRFTNPLLLKNLIGFVEDPTRPFWQGLMLAFGMFVIATSQTVILSQVQMRIFRIGMNIRTVLTSAVYKKSLTLANTAKKDKTVGEVVNLMSVDVQRIQDTMVHINMIWSAPVQVVIAMFLLWQILGPSVLVGLSVMIILMPLNFLVAKRMHGVQVTQMIFKDERTKLVSEILNGIKLLKLYAWEPAFQKLVDETRKKEVAAVRRHAVYRAASVLFFHTGPILVALVSFTTFVLSDEKNILTPQVVFVSLTLFELLRLPVAILPMLISAMVQAMVSVKRLRVFLAEDEIDTTAILKESCKDAPSAVKIENGSFAWERPQQKDEEAEPVLRNISLEIKPGKLVAFVGQVGAGKSSMLSAILGEMEKLSGRVCISGSIGYVSQQAWIRNDSVRDNILFGKPMDNVKYKEVIDACALRPDLKMFPGGDAMEIGEKGINLSGGQKLRVSLARAAYQDQDVYLLDDPLSAVDSHVGKHIFNNVIGNNGLLKDKTRILVTHGLQYLKDVDVIVVIQDGQISEVGSFEQLKESEGAFSLLLQEHALETSDEKDEENTGEPETPTKPTLDKGGSLDKGGDIIQEESSAKGNVSWSVYHTYFKAVGYLFILVGWGFVLLAAICQSGTHFWLADWSSESEKFLRNLTSAPSFDTGSRLGVYTGIALISSLAMFAAIMLLALASCKASEIMHGALLLNILRSPMSFFDTTPLGRILNRFGKDIFMMDQPLPDILRMWFFCCTSLLVRVVTISIATPAFLIALLPLGTIYFLVLRFYVSTARQLKRIEAVSRSPIYSHFQETFQGASSVRAYGVEKQFISESEKFVDKNITAYFPTIIASRWQAVRLEFVGNCIVLFAALFAVVFRESVSPGLVGLSVSYALTITPVLYMAVVMTSELESNIVSVERIKEYTDIPTEAEWESSPDAKPALNWPSEGRVEFADYSTRYREGLSLVLNDISMTVSPVEKIGLVGRTGAGKSSVTLSLFRIIEAARGKIFIDGVDVSKIGLHDLRKKLTIIPQDPVLFSGTLRLNLDPFDCYEEDAIWTALEHASLKTFVSSLPEKLEHRITEGGENLSVGQRQLVCLARALLRKTKILILDEATAAIDMETDQLIQKTIRTEFKDCTILTIAHRLSTIMDSDRVVLLDQGQIVEFDNPQKLLENKNSLFFKMAKDAGLASD